MRMSVVVPARDEEERLPALLAALAVQRRPPDEVIVVDNASRDHTAGVARAWGARVVACPRPGVAQARQAGLLAATGDWIASTDADSRPESDWLARLEAHTADAVALYGPLRFSEVSPLSAQASEWLYRAFLGLSARAGRPNLAGANMAFSRAAALAVGGYPAVEAREDVLLGLRLMQLGPVRYLPGALVHTSARRLRRGWGHFLWQQARSLSGQTAGYFDP